MGLSMHDRRALAEIERGLTEQDPELARLLATSKGPLRAARWAVRGVVDRVLRAAAGLAVLAGFCLVVTGGSTHRHALVVGGVLLVAAGLPAAAYGLVRHRAARRPP